MLSQSVTLIRGLPGAGKAALARYIRQSTLIKMEDFWPKGGQKLEDAHFRMVQEVCLQLYLGRNVVITGIFLTRKEVEAYKNLVSLRTSPTSFLVIDLFDGGKSDAQLVADCCYPITQEEMAQLRELYESKPVWANEDAEMEKVADGLTQAMFGKK